MFGLIGDWLARRRTMRELEALTKEEQESLNLSQLNPLYHAKMSIQAGDKNAAGQYWDQARQKMPDYILKSIDSTQILLGLERYDELEALMQKGRARWPREPRYLTGIAETWEKRGDQKKAAEIWKQATVEFPYLTRAYLGEAHCLRRLGNHEEARHVLESAKKHSSREVMVWTDQAFLSELDKDWPNALATYDDAAERFPHHHGGFIGGARVCEAMGDMQGALARLSHARSLNPQNVEAWEALAGLEERAGLIDKAAATWNSLRMTIPLKVTAHLGYARCLVAQGNLASARAILEGATQRFPEDPAVARDLAKLPHGSGEQAASAQTKSAQS